MAFSAALVLVLEVYAVLGLAFAIPFVWSWVRRLDPVAADGTWGFRLLILPGAAALWPLLAMRLLRARPGSGAAGSAEGGPG